MLVVALMIFATSVAWAKTADMSNVRGMLVPVQKTVLASRLNATIVELDVRFGSRFRQGQQLLKYDCQTNVAELKVSQAELKAASAKHDNNLMQARYGSLGELEVQLSEADVNKYRAEVEKHQIDVNMCQVMSPFSGRVVKLHVDPFQFVKIGEPLLEVLDDSDLEVILYVPSHWLKWLRPGVSFKMEVSETGRAYPGQVMSIGAQVDAASRTIELRGKLSRHFPDLLPGMSGSVSFKSNRAHLSQNMR
uniref:CusB-like beta-barrel domain-containing protein n=1 Tax=Magnetococcus massalia (strain MO-1) TaxID=451514 RepID=A0A1S7LD39_MAGMO|nr:conserved exported protein of unknown function [Candidatus Magnetococcus massalia]